MTNTVNLQRMLQTETQPAKKQENTSVKNDSGQDFKSLVTKKTDKVKEEKETPKQETKPEEDDTDKKAGEKLKLGEVVPLADLLFTRPEALTDREIEAVISQLPGAGIEKPGSQILDSQLVNVAEQGAVMTSNISAETVVSDLYVGKQVADMTAEKLNSISAGVDTTKTSQNLKDVSAADLHSSGKNKASALMDNSTGKKQINVDKNQNIKESVDNHPVMEEKPLAANVTRAMSEAVKEESAEETGILTQLPADEKTENDGSSDRVLNSDIISAGTHQEEVVKIKVAEPYSRLNPEAVNDLADKITDHIQNGKREFTVQLNPEMLGKIAVKISMAEDGIKVTLSCEKQKTCQLLAEQASGINRIVEHNTGQPSVVEVKEGYWDQQKDATDQHSRQNQNQEQNQQDRTSKAETDDFIQQLRLGFYENKIVV